MATIDRLDDLVKTFITDLFQRTIDRTPVKTGRLVNNWNFSVDSPNTATIDATGTKDEKIAELETFVATLKAGDHVYMSNGIPYAYPVETGSSKQSPSGMVQITAIEAENVLNEAKLKVGL